MDDGHFRASDAERDAVVEDLRSHTAAGRLSLDEFGERTAEALAAVTRDDLQRVLRDLPEIQPEPATEPARGSTTPRRASTVPWSRLARVAIGVAVVALVITTPLWWVVFPLFFWTGGFGLFGAGGCGTRTSADDERGRGRGMCGGGWGRRGGWHEGRWWDDAGWSDARRPNARTGRDPADDHDDELIRI